MKVQGKESEAGACVRKYHGKESEAGACIMFLSINQIILLLITFFFGLFYLSDVRFKVFDKIFLSEYYLLF